MKLQIMNAAGTAKTIEHIRNLARCEATSEITWGTLTSPERAGNSGRTFFMDPEGMTSANSLGIPNRGAHYLKEVGHEAAAIVHDAGKLLRISIQGSTIDELVELTETAVEVGADVIENNFSCPNVWKGGEQKRIWAFDTGLMKPALIAQYRITGTRSKLAAKLSPYTNPDAFPLVSTMVKELRRDGIHVQVVYANAYPNGFLWDIQTEPTFAFRQAIDNERGLAGIAGPGYLAMVLGGHRQFQALDPEMERVGVGGICDGWSIAQYLLTETTALQMNTALYSTGDPGTITHAVTDFVNRYPTLAEQYMD